MNHGRSVLGGTPNAALSGGPFNLNEWHHMAVVIDVDPVLANSVQKFYLDGVLTATVNGRIPETVTGGELLFGIHKFRGGRSDLVGRAWDGFIDDIRIYTGVKSQADVQGYL